MPRDGTARRQIEWLAKAVERNLDQIRNLQESRVSTLKIVLDLEKRVKALEALQWTPEEVQGETG